MHLFNAQTAEADADEAREAAALNAFKTRKLGKKVTSSARATLGASGVAVDRGTGERLQSAIGEASETDALEQIMFGDKRAARLEKEAEMQRQAAENARKAGKRNAFGSLLQGGAQMFGAWK